MVAVFSDFNIAVGARAIDHYHAQTAQELLVLAASIACLLLCKRKHGRLTAGCRRR